MALAELKATQELGTKHLVLITDGQPTQSLGCIGNGMTCYSEPTQPVVDAIAAAATKDHIKTFIVGSPGSEKNDCTNADVRDWLSAAARVGQTATANCSDTGPRYCHFDLSQASDFGKALAESLSTIMRSVVTCDYDVPPPPTGETIDTDRVNLIYGAGADSFNLILPSSSANCSLGWQFTDDTKTKIHVCEQTCKLMQQNSLANVTLLFGCTQQEVSEPIQ